MQKPFVLLILLITTHVFSQTSAKKTMESIETTDQAQLYLKAKKSKKNKLLTFNSENHKTKLSKALLSLPVGASKTIDSEFSKTHYKVMEQTKAPYYRISYIFLDGNRLKDQEIIALKQNIIKKYNSGMRFDDLARQYSMAENANTGGDTGWLQDGDLPELLEEETKDLSHKLGDIYTLSIPSEQGYYIILKTYRIQTIKVIKVLKIVEDKS